MLYLPSAQHHLLDASASKATMKIQPVRLCCRSMAHIFLLQIHWQLKTVFLFAGATPLAHLLACSKIWRLEMQRRTLALYTPTKHWIVQRPVAIITFSKFQVRVDPRPVGLPAGHHGRHVTGCPHMEPCRLHRSAGVSTQFSLPKSRIACTVAL